MTARCSWTRSANAAGAADAPAAGEHYTWPGNVPELRNLMSAARHLGISRTTIWRRLRAGA